MAKDLRTIQAVAGEGELHRGDTYLGQVIYGFSAVHDVEFIESSDARADIKAPEIDLWALMQEKADLTLQLNNGRRWECRVGRINDRLLGKRGSLIGRPPNAN